MGETMRTVRDFKKFVLQEAGVVQGFELRRRSRNLGDFWDELNDLGWEKRTKPPEEADDVDATAPLTNKEWSDLEARFRQLC